MFWICFISTSHGGHSDPLNCPLPHQLYSFIHCILLYTCTFKFPTQWGTHWGSQWWRCPGQGCESDSIHVNSRTMKKQNSILRPSFAMHDFSQGYKSEGTRIVRTNPSHGTHTHTTTPTMKPVVWFNPQCQSLCPPPPPLFILHTMGMHCGTKSFEVFSFPLIQSKLNIKPTMMDGRDGVWC